jgi:hypothetical protein
MPFHLLKGIPCEKCCVEKEKYRKKFPGSGS